jgi:hypothetical protein
VKPSAMAPSLKTHFLEAHRCSIPSTPSPHILRAFTFLCVVYLRVSSLSRASGRGSSLVFGVHRASFLDWGSFHGSDSSIFWYLRCHRVCASSGFRLWATGLPFHVFLVTSPPVGWLRLVLHALSLQWSLV